MPDDMAPHVLSKIPEVSMLPRLLPVEGLYENPADGELAARAVIEGGLGEAIVRPLTEVNLALLPTPPEETRKRMVRCLLAIPVGFIVLAPPGFAVAMIAGPLVGVFAGLMMGAIGAIVAFLLMDRPPERYRQLADHNGVLLTIACERTACDRVLEILRNTHPAQLFAPHLT